MIKGLIIYNEIDKNKNEWFINKCLKEMNDARFSLLYKEEKEVIPYVKDNKIDFVIYRGRDYRLLEQLEKLGVKCFNNSLTNKIANDKYATYELCKKNNIPCLETFLNNHQNLEYPFIMKNLNGHGGNNVYLIHDELEEKEVLKKSQEDYVYQTYIKNASDVRLYVLNHQVVGAVKRSNTHDFRSNYSLGGEVMRFEPTQEMIDISLKLSKLLNADYIGVDFLINADKIYLNEIEDPVGARMLYKISDIDVISLFLEEIKSQLKQ